MITRTIKMVLVVFTSFALMQSCDDRFDLQPEDERLTADAAFEDPAAYKEFLAKIYAGISLSGQQGPAGAPDLAGLDEGFSNYLRLYWKMQELTTDEAIIGWNDGTIQDLHGQIWTSGNEFIRTMYSRLMYQVALCNEYLRQTTEAKLDGRGVAADLRAEIQTYRAESRFMRALTYWHAMDLFANPPFVTEDDPIGAFLPPQIQRADLFDFVETELLSILDEMAAPMQNEYGRADRAAAWMLLAKLYLNAEEYTGNARYNDVITYTNNIIGAGYTVNTGIPYFHSFLADNHENGAESEVIFTIPFDGLRTQAFGGMTFLVHAPVGGSMNPAEYGINGGWFGIRTTPTFVEQFPGEENSADGRSLLYTDGQNKDIMEVGPFNQGYAVSKFRNVDVDGNPGSDASGNHTDIDFPMFRLADAYLMYAEATLRGGGGSVATAVDYINELRLRAYGDTSGNISDTDLTLDFILDERSRELYWEGHRRTDLVRFGQFSDQGVWQWKGNVQQGSTTEAFRDIMPIPATDLGLNTNLSQNPGY
ncbi:RagB/SusD family nutrient uptake outer membrane protein [Ichthyenterobacterium sp. W332]|uniref:RagB/SusD family nutrient uptake outer membrane protein n=1 Tax=Microcosmobacter mediterraneus TaxID=3075607 RepID=A0ABU2YL97_9FLAO|nr:RagB/SusD family nutrient uptake outer membrane protein [Ichthyenterobacterium sp. W332]MDT0558934.1 RagB/SusD family nutrient uptake outer membrane protein [Ichthyenterobacterium sp. W332]